MKRRLLCSALTVIFVGPALSQDIMSTDLKTKFESALAAKIGDDAGVTVVFAAAELPADIGKAVDAIAASTNYIGEKLCRERGRPTTIKLNLTASFDLVFGASTGSEVTWEMDQVCTRMGID